MAGFDRSKYQTMTKETLEKQNKEQQEKRPSRQGGYAGYHKIDDGDNRFRLLPFHQDGLGTSIYQPKCISFLEVTKEKRDAEGKKVEGEFELKNSPVFNAKVHGNLPKDLVEEYMQFAKDIAIPNFTGDATIQKAIWSNIVGYQDAKKVYHSGIKPSDTWVCYALKYENGDWKLGKLELKKTMKDQLTDLALEVTNGESPDPYTNIEDGYIIKISKTGTGKDTRYKVAIDQEMISKTQSQYLTLALTDEIMEEFEKLPSLAKEFVGSYKRQTFDWQVEGLQNFDKKLALLKYPIDVFAYSEFMDIIEEVSNLVPEDEPEAEGEDQGEPAAPVATKPTVSKPAVTTAKPAVTVKTTTVAKPTPPVTKTVVKTATPVLDQALSGDTPSAEPVIETSATQSTTDRLAAMKARYGKK